MTIREISIRTATPEKVFPSLLSHGLRLGVIWQDRFDLKHMKAADSPAVAQCFRLCLQLNRRFGRASTFAFQTALDGQADRPAGMS